LRHAEKSYFYHGLLGSIQAKHQKITLSEGSYRSDSDKAAKRAELKKNPPV
jgi:hypothetical protein